MPQDLWKILSGIKKSHNSSPQQDFTSPHLLSNHEPSLFKVENSYSLT